MPYTQDNSPSTSGQDQPANSTTIFPTPKHGHIVALVVTLALVAILMVAVIAYFSTRMRRANSQQDPSRQTNTTRDSAVFDIRHPASHITPFSMCQPDSAPTRFNTMRIAVRRHDGAWDFADPEAPFTPTGVTDPLLSPVSPVSPSISVRSTIKEKIAEARADRSRRRETTNSHTSGLEPPPPAYRPEDHSNEGYPNGKN